MATPKNSTKSSSRTAKSLGSSPLKYAVVGVVVLLAIVVLVSNPSILGPKTNTALSNNLPPVESPSEIVLPDSFDDPSINLEFLKNTLSKEKFLKKLFEVDRDSYHLYDKAAKFMGITTEEVTQFFYNCCDLTSEADIFSELPPVPEGFSATAYDVSTGKLNQIGLLDESYYKQPEFYSFIDDQTGVINREYSLRPWSKPVLNQWGDNGMQAYPADQFDSLSLSGRKEFTATIFVTNGWNIQNYVGLQLVANSEALKYFDITISEDLTGKSYFLLSPTFPRFTKDWATKVFVTGKIKPNTPPGTYQITINPVQPAKELSTKWANDHPGLYAAYGFIAPSSGYINLTIDVSA